MKYHNFQQMISRIKDLLRLPTIKKSDLFRYLKLLLFFNKPFFLFLFFFLLFLFLFRFSFIFLSILFLFPSVPPTAPRLLAACKTGTEATLDTFLSSFSDFLGVTQVCWFYFDEPDFFEHFLDLFLVEVVDAYTIIFHVEILSKFSVALAG